MDGQLENLSDEELEKIICQAENTHIDGSMYLKAKNILEVRRNRKLFTLQVEALRLQNRANIHRYNANKIFLSLLGTAQSGLDRIIKVLDKPGLAIFLAGIGAVIIGIVINFLTDLYHLLPLFHAPK